MLLFVHISKFVTTRMNILFFFPLICVVVSMTSKDRKRQPHCTYATFYILAITHHEWWQWTVEWIFWLKENKFCIRLKVPSFLASLFYITTFYFGPDKLQVIHLLQMIYNLRRKANCTCGSALVSLSPCWQKKQPFIRCSEDGEQLWAQTK